MAGDLEGAGKAALWYKNLFGEDYYLEVMRHPAADPKQRAEIYDNQQRCIQEKIKIARKLNIKLIATNDVHFLNEEDAEAHDLLICLNTRKTSTIRPGCGIPVRNGLKPPRMIDLFPDLPEAIENTQEITDKVEEYELDSDPLMPVFFFLFPELGTEEEYRQNFSQEDLFNEFTRDERKCRTHRRRSQQKSKTGRIRPFISYHQTGSRLSERADHERGCETLW